MTVEVSAINLVGAILPQRNSALVEGVEAVTILSLPANSAVVSGIEVVTILSPNPPDTPTPEPTPPLEGRRRRSIIIAC